MTQEESIERFNQRAELEHNLIEAKYALSSTDYKILKIYEARIMEKADPYNAEEVIALREQARADVNKYEQLIADFDADKE
jgi:hypothetical protein